MLPTPASPLPPPLQSIPAGLGAVSSLGESVLGVLEMLGEDRSVGNMLRSKF